MNGIINFKTAGLENVWRMTAFAALCLLIFSSRAVAQSESPACRTDCRCSLPQNENAAIELHPGETLKRRFETGESSAHVYRIELPAAQFIRIRIQQNGIDVTVCACESKRKIDATDGTGVEEFSFISENEKFYSFAVRTFAEATAGDYTITVAEARPAVAADPKLVRAEDTLREAEMLRAENCPGALAEYQAAGELYEQLECSDCRLKRAEILYRIGGYTASSGKHAAAAAYFERSLKLVEDQPPTDLRVVQQQWLALTDLGLALSRLGNFAAARPKLERAMILLKAHLSGDSQPDYARLLNIYANLLIETGEPSPGLVAVEEGLHNLPAENVRASLLLNKGLAADALGDSFAALDLYAEAAKISKNQADRARMLINSGIIRERFGDLDAAQTDYEAARQIGESANLEEIEAHALRSLGVFYLNSYGTTKILAAREKLTAAVELFKKLENSFEVEKTKVYLATILYRERKFGEAAQIYQAAQIALACDQTQTAPAQNAFLCGLILNNAGAVFYEQKDFTRARAAFLFALDRRRIASDTSGQAETNYNLAVLETRQSVPDHRVMFRYFNAARILYRQTRDRRGESAVLYEMALGVRKQSRTEAVGYLRAALKNSGAISRNLGADDLRLGANATASDYWKLYLDLVMEEANSPSPAFGLLLSERARAQSLRQNLEESNVRIEGDNLPECRNLAEDKKLYAGVLRRRDEKEQALLNPRLADDQKSALRREIDAIDEETTRLKVKLKSGCPKFADLAFSSVPDAGGEGEVEQLQALIEKDTAVLEYSLGTDSSYLWVVTGTSVNYFRLPNKKAIEQQTRLVREMLTDKKLFFQPLSPNYPAAVKKLSTMILPDAPVKSLPPGTKLIVIADGELLNLPLAILPLAASGKLLIESREVDYLPSLSVLGELRKKRTLISPEKRERRLALFSSPVFSVSDNSFPPAKKALMSADTAHKNVLQFKPLYFVRENDCRLVDIFLGSIAVGSNTAASKCVCLGSASCSAENKILWKRVREATKRSFIAAPLGEFTDIILLTHGVYNAENSPTGAGQNGMYFSYFAENGEPLEIKDYLLEPNDIYNLKLKTSLVTLGACETSLGINQTGEGLLNMTRGFIWAGASGVTATLWSVEEETTMDIILQMNQAMLEENLPPASALRQAQLEAMNDNPDPRRWAGIIYYGDWKPDF